MAMHKPQLSQFMTPTWAAERLVAHFFPGLNQTDLVVEPTCGDGRFLMALPGHVPAVGWELDPALAQQARVNSGREVLCTDALETPFPTGTSLVIGNPPFKMAFFQSLLERMAEGLDYGARGGFITPMYFLQTAATVKTMNRHFSLEQVILPRNLWDGMEKPVAWLMLEKRRRPTLTGFFLYEETNDIRSLDPRYRTLFIGNASAASVWAVALEAALVALGGEASLQDIYREIEGKQPTETVHWKEQLRKVARQRYPRTAKGRYRLPYNHEINFAA